MNQLELWEQEQYDKLKADQQKLQQFQQEIKKTFLHNLEEIKAEYLKEYAERLNGYDIQFVDGIFAYIAHRI